MHGNAQLKSFADSRRFHTRPNASPECRVEKNHIDCGIQHVSGELFKIDDNRVGRKRHANHLPRAAHAVKTEYRILEVVVV